MHKIGAEIRSRCGTWNKPYWAYGYISDIKPDHDGGLQYKIIWDSGSMDYLYPFEFEIVEVEIA